METVIQSFFFAHLFTKNHIKWFQEEGPDDNNKMQLK